MQMAVRIPRLVRLSRQAQQFPEDAATRADAVALASELFELGDDLRVHDLMRSGGIDRVDSHDPDDLTPSSLKFRDVRVLALLCQYWEWRVVICGCIERLVSLDPIASPSCVFPHSSWKVQQSDVEAATYIAMSFRQMNTLVERCPSVKLGCIYPVQMVFSAFYRLEKRESLGVTGVHPSSCQLNSDITGGLDTARTMQSRCVELQNLYLRGWYPGVVTHELNQILSEIYTGGSIPLLMTAQHASSQVESS